MALKKKTAFVDNKEKNIEGNIGRPNYQKKLKY